MAKNKFSLDFEGFLDYARQLDELGKQYLQKATDNALNKSKEYANEQVIEAMNSSPYNFKGNKRSTGQSKKSAQKVSEMPVEWNGTVATAYSGVSWYDAPEVTLLAYGTPHIKGDTKLLNAIKCKGAIRKEVSRIQQEEFVKVLQEAMKENG